MQCTRQRLNGSSRSYPIFNKLSTNSTKNQKNFHNFIIEFVATTDEHFDSALSSIAALFNSSSTTKSDPSLCVIWSSSKPELGVMARRVLRAQAKVPS
ncbi:unnamed protein product [Prunus armeniaca]|uniref:Uncharacterized protein n=1 Tax=Prunus armeniaca TaxID=36596 RepID=A0A6J5VYK2_PRUAR|nr:unnamed protein product [Prunus armeniaca]CAB4294319.1 unnamed protein product [Prunus armeniaca]